MRSAIFVTLMATLIVSLGLTYGAVMIGDLIYTLVQEEVSRKIFYGEMFHTSSILRGITLVIGGAVGLLIMGFVNVTLWRKAPGVGVLAGVVATMSFGFLFGASNGILTLQGYDPTQWSTAMLIQAWLVLLPLSPGVLNCMASMAFGLRPPSSRRLQDDVGNGDVIDVTVTDGVTTS